jgi:integrase
VLDAGRLRPRQVETVKEDGMYADGGGLYLQVRLGGRAKSWIFRYAVDGRERSMGLGPLDTIGLAEARERARKCRQQRLDGIDPIEARKALRLDQQLAKAKQVTFRQCAEAWMAVEDVGWCAEYARDTKRKFEKHVYPHLNRGNMPVQVLDGNASNASQLVADILTPIWKTKPVAAERVRQQIDFTLQYAAAKQYIGNPNAASLKGPLGVLLPAQKTFKKVKHHAALPFDQIGKFMADLRSRSSSMKYWRNAVASGSTTSGRSPVTLDMLEFLILTAVRKDQVYKAKWEDFDFNNKIWFCPDHKTKKKTGHQDYVTPLSRQAMAVLDRMREMQATNGLQTEYVFVEPRWRKSRMKGSHLTKSSLNQTMRRIGRSDITPHGFRTTFRTWSEEYGYPEKDSEMALGHAVGNTVRNIYARYAQKIEPRRIMMQAWGDYCDRAELLPGDVIQFQRKRKEEQTR